MITERTATDIALIHREIKVSEELLDTIDKVRADHDCKDVRDSFGRVKDGLELGVPTGDSSKRLFRLNWKLARPVIEEHIADCNAQLALLNMKAIDEAGKKGGSNMQSVSIKKAEEICKEGDLDGVIILGFKGEAFISASYGKNREQYTRFAKSLNQICDRIESGDISI